MKSSTGKHFIALDHIRALATFLVFTWHFISYPGFTFPHPPAFFPFAIFDQGHCGVSLFMVLSGYLFAKLLEGKTINYRSFLWNRFLRLFPLLIVVLAIITIQRALALHDSSSLIWSGLQLIRGIVVPALPHGRWSITVEFHFYLILPLLLCAFRRSPYAPIFLILTSIALRSIIYASLGEVQYVAYWTIIGRIDQFVLGIAAFKNRKFIYGKHRIAAYTIVSFLTFYWLYDLAGGFYGNRYAELRPLWILMPTIEAVAFAVAIAWYDGSFSHSLSPVSRFVGKLGSYSYSIYLLHFFFVSFAARFINDHVMQVSNFYVALLWSLICLLTMYPIGYLSFRLIESPFLRLRVGYFVQCHKPAADAQPPGATHTASPLPHASIS